MYLKHLNLLSSLFLDFTGYSEIYCSMDSYICEEGYERWTIFFGHENLIK